MSINSKARRDARRKHAPHATRRPAPMPALAHLLDRDEAIVGGIAQRDGEYVFVFGGRVITSTDSAAMAIALLDRAIAVHASRDVVLRRRVSEPLLTAATREAADAGLTLEAQLVALEAERIEHMQKRSEPGAAGPTH
ncbi:hypothetical protein GCM10007067_08450 [Lysobacter bugurensis]|uniref:Uncharacterized protein n=2 Tax=Cognatilysobacter bugurensis TaxID=543356 RepID=A0A918SVU3_9GAMM|nr:hypothetical protein GCM10007067_08450 [Lysobacter bugurensis]